MESITSKLMCRGWLRFSHLLKSSLKSLRQSLGPASLEGRKGKKPQPINLLTIATCIKSGILLVTCLTVIGCATPESLYYWGDYENLVYEMYVEPGAADPATQVQKLKEDISEASAKGKRVPPGLRAHLGYMYFLQGNTHDAALEFGTEKKLFPESTKFIDGLMGRLKK